LKPRQNSQKMVFFCFMPKELRPSPNLLPTFSKAGEVRLPSRVFSTTHLPDEHIESLLDFAEARRSDDPEANQYWEYGTDEFLSMFPWMSSWVEGVDSFVEKRGQFLTPPIMPGRNVKVVLFDERPSKEHIDNFWQQPTALTIGLKGLRQVIGVQQDDFAQANKLITDLREYEVRLYQLAESEGHAVERVTQKPGDVVGIANYNSVHMGIPLPSDEPNLAIAIARQGYALPGYAASPEGKAYLAQQYYNRIADPYNLGYQEAPL
jgi:hypothetical protein